MVQNNQKKITKYIILIFIFLIGIYMNVSNPPLLSIFNITPDIYIGLLVIYSINLNPVFLLFFLFLIGFVVDAYIGFITGFHSLLFLIMGFFIIKIRSYIYEHNTLIKLILIFIMSFIYRIIYSFIIIRDFSSLSLLLKNIIFIPVYTLILFSIIEIIVNIFICRQKYE